MYMARFINMREENNCPCYTWFCFSIFSKQDILKKTNFRLTFSIILRVKGARSGKVFTSPNANPDLDY